MTFRLKGVDLRLEPAAAGKELFFMFKDRTAGRQTCGSGRFLDAGRPDDGEALLDAT